MKDDQALNRRSFITGTVSGAVAASLLPGSRLLASASQDEAEKPKIKEYRMLGRTGFKVSDISSGYCASEAVIKALLDAGVNYIDTAESYKNQPAVGKGIQGRDRKTIFITSKLEIKKEDTKETLTNRFNKSLEELQTDYIDAMMIHSCPDVETVKHADFHAVMAEMKSKGKLRFIGISNHGASFVEEAKIPMEDVLCAAAADGRFDVMLLTYNFLSREGGDKVLQACAEKNIGTTLMKVNPVGSYYKMKERIDKALAEGRKIPDQYKDYLQKMQKEVDKAQGFIEEHHLTNPAEITAAAIRWTLNNPKVHAVCLAAENFAMASDYVKLSGTRLSAKDEKKLQAYAGICGQFYCRHSCGKCEASCPRGVPVNTIMRFHHYYDAHGREKLAMKQYAGLTAPNAGGCAECAGHCEAACPFGVKIHGLLDMAHRRLSLV